VAEDGFLPQPFDHPAKVLLLLEHREYDRHLARVRHTTRVEAVH
jgi:hypothetical protein